MATKNYSIRAPAPKRRNVLAVGAYLRTGAGKHQTATKPGPDASEWDWDLSDDVEEKP
jgi:hypothetical protein